MSPFHKATPILASVFAVAMLAGCSQGSGSNGDGSTASSERHQIRIVGSSTVFPFSAYVAEEFGVTTKYPAPVVESTGTGGGIELFCKGTSLSTPDIVNASRRMTPSEFESCHNNGVDKVVELKFGYDGIVIGYKDGQPQWNLTLKQLTLAVARKVPKNGELVLNPYNTWNDIDPSLPKQEILIYGPPSSSGTRDAFEELVMAAVTKKMEAYDGAYTVIRQDGKYVPSSENDNLIVQKVAQNPAALGIFGFSYLAENRNLVDAATINGVVPKRELISTGKYPISRSLFFYVKVGHLKEIPSIDGYVDLFLSEQMIGERGYLTDLGLIPLPKDKRQAMRQRWDKRVTLTKEDLKE